MLGIEREFERHREADTNITPSDLQKKLERLPRMPPTTWEQVTMLLTTEALLMKMLFTPRSPYLRGLNDVRRQVMGLSSTKHTCMDQSFGQL